MNKNLLIIGAGGHGRVVKETAEAMESFEKIDFLDDNSEIAIGKCKDFKRYINEYTYAFPALGSNELRKKWIEDLIEVGFKLPTLIHPTAYVSPSARISGGTILCAKAVVYTNSIVENGCIISIGALVDHDCTVGECSHINTGAIIMAGSKVGMLKRIDAGMIYSDDKKAKDALLR